jgi:hypothetical protein
LRQTLSTKNTVSQDVKPLNLSSEELESYYKVYKNPFVLYLRKAINAYLNKDTSEVNISQIAIEEKREKDTISGLRAFDKSYYESKFVVLKIDDAVFGGKEIQIIFQDKPDRVFNAWVYKGKDYELRSFYSKEVNEKIIKDIIEESKQYIFDKEHAL